MSSAQAAASAAFLGTKAPMAPSAHKRRPLLRLRMPGGLSLTKNVLSSGALEPATPSERLGAHTDAHSPPNPMARGAKTATCASTKPGPGKPVPPTARNLPIQRLEGTQTPVLGSSAARSRRRSHAAVALLSAPDEFSVAASTGHPGLLRPPSAAPSLSLHDIATELSKPARLPGTAPQEMLDSVRLLINTKQKTGSQKDATRRGQQAVSEFRQSVDLRIHHSLASLRVSVCENTSIGSGKSTERELFIHPGASRSRVSVGSVVSDNFETNGDNLNPANNSTLLLTPNFKLSFLETASDILHQTPPSPHNTPLPIPVPLSALGVDRGLGGSAPDVSARPLLSGNGAENIHESENVSSKPGRKKPPSLHGTDSFATTSGLDLESVSGSQFSDFETDDSESVQFPLFPGLSTEKHHHRIGLFSKNRSKRDKGVVYDPAAAHDSDAELSLAPAQRSISKNGLVHQPVKLRATMRKKDKRKERKTAFNEDKPWKNHGDLDVISDAQRKRYEGLWVSNKGLYLNHVATKLVGVNYANDDIVAGRDDAVLSKTVREYSEREISERAAQLSASTNFDFDLTDARALHSLDEATTQNLIHGSVVRLLWRRSNLPRDTLKAIWDLVDFRKDGTLNKAEFIVGMWLVDQRLYGRKLPKVVNKLVWSSLGGLGVNVVIKKKRR